MKADRITIARILITVGIAPYLLIGVPNMFGFLIFSKQTQSVILNIAVYWFIGVLALMMLLSALYSTGTANVSRKTFKISSRTLGIVGVSLIIFAALMFLVVGFTNIGNGFFDDVLLPELAALLIAAGALLLTQSIYQTIKKQ